MIITKEIEFTMCAKIKEYYHSLGYIYENGEKFVVPVETLKDNSCKRIDVRCDYCERVYSKRYADYVKNKKLSHTDKDCCSNCIHLKTKETMQSKYGVDNCNKIDFVKEKTKSTLIKKYGDNYKNESIKHIRAYAEKYGVENVSQIPHIREKINNSLNINGTQNTSKNQTYLSNLYKGEINYLYEKYWLDSYFPEYKIYMEYDGSGHDICVRYKKVTKEEFFIKECTRGRYLKSYGLKCFRIVSRKDKLPSEEILKSMKDFVIEFFQDNDRSWVLFDIDNSFMEYKDNKYYYDFSHTLNYSNFKITNSL